MAFERVRSFRGLYHVLHGLISPMDGITPDALTLRELLLRLEDGIVKERLKYVRATFLQCVMSSQSHWQSRPIVPNQLAGREGATE